MNRKGRTLFLWLCSLWLLSGCESKEEKWGRILSDTVIRNEARLVSLKQQIGQGRVFNSKILQQYASTVLSQRPEMAELIEALASDATADGPTYQSLRVRLDDARKQAAAALARGEFQVRTVLDELGAIYKGANPVTYNMMLTDPINVLADMSGGTLARVEAMSKEASLKANEASDFGAGSQLVGNPNYGQWQSNSSGGSFWAWYGQYHFFSRLIGGPVYYGSWANRRGYSYYHDRGWNTYTSPGQKRSQETLYKNTKTKFQKTGQRFESPYAKSRSGSSTTRTRNASQTASKGQFRSNYANGRATGSSTSRNSSYRSSRSSRSGK